MIRRKQFQKTIQIVLLIMLLLSPMIPSLQTLNISDNPSYNWNDDWCFSQSVQTNIETSSSYAAYQPIDINVEFLNKCWGINESIHSIRVVCWNGSKYNELESQIYNIKFSEENEIISCNVIFLIPSYANGKERYYVYYNDKETQAPYYKDHVFIEDSFYYYEPITGISVEGDFYKITDDDEIVYGIGQKGKVLNRELSQIAIRMKPGTVDFDILNSDLLTSFCFSYQNGPDDENEISSDHTLIGKEVTIDGNLMTEFIIISQSENGDIKTSNVYRYYHCPSENKRITAHVKHDIVEDLIVKDEINNDGKFGGIISYYSKSDSMKKMQFGDILPYLHVYSEQDRINEYQLIINPESSKKEWVLSYDDNCDLGSSAWLSYSEGANGKTHGIIFSSNENIVSNASDERDGIQIKVSEKEYLDLVGAEIDYASISFGRNSYEPLQSHDLFIDKGLHIEFDVEFISIQEGNFENINEESGFFQTLVSYRDVSTNESLGEQYINTLTVIPHLTGRIGSFPLIVNSTNIPLPTLYAELYKDNELVASSFIQKSLLGFKLIKFPKLKSGDYTIKLFRFLGNQSRFIGIGHCNLSKDKTLHVYCTWEKTISVHAVDQIGNFLPNITFQLMQGSLLVHESISSDDIHKISIPFALFDSYESTDIKNYSFSKIFSSSPPYYMRAWYKGFKIFNATLSTFEKSIKFSLPVYDIVVSITDELNKPPAVNINPFLTSKDMQNLYEIYPERHANGKYYFSDIPAASYDIHISYGGYTKSKTIDIPSAGDLIDLRFSYTTDLSFELLTIRGESYEDDTLNIEIKRLGSIIFDDINHKESVQVPPGIYTINVYEKGVLIGSKSSQVTHDTVISIVTIRGSFIQTVFVFSALILLVSACFLFLKKRITFNVALKLIVLGLVFFSLVQPWWSFSGISEDESFEKTSEMYLFPQIMIEEYHDDSTLKLSISTIPEIFLDFLFYLTVVIGFGMILMFISFIPNIILKRRFAFLLAFISIVFVLIVALSFYVGMSSITELSLGSLQGNGMIDVTMPSGERIYMKSLWGLGTGFYTIIIAASISISAAIYDIFKSKRQVINKLIRILTTKK